MKRVVSFVLGCFVLAVAARAADRPNILFCISDDQSFPHTSAYGTKWVQTPAFDRVAREGLLFMRGYTPNAKCAPSRASVLTGRYSWQLEEAANHSPSFPAKFRTVMEALAVNGYATGWTGKGWSPGSPGQVDGKPRQLTGPAFNQIRGTPPTPAISPLDYAANFAQFLEKKPKDKPFMFWYGAIEPHRRYTEGSGQKLGGKSTASIDRVPGFWPDNDTVRGDMLDYAFEIEHFDKHLGRIIEQLEKAGELENTLIVITSDNGMPFPRAKGATYELSNHMPLAMRWGKGIAQPGRRVEDYVSFVDFAPTFLEVAGVSESAAGMQPFGGRSLMPLFRGGGAVAGRDYTIIGQERHDVGRPADVGYPVRGIFKDGFLYLRNFEPGRWPMCDPFTGYLNTDGSPTKTLILEQNRRGLNHWLWELNFGRRPAEELYDLKADPDCMVNLAGRTEHAVRREALQKQLFDDLKKTQDPRMEGKGEVFDQYRYFGVADYYEKFMKGEKQAASWVDETDYEKAGFDPERPLAPVK